MDGAGAGAEMSFMKTMTKSYLKALTIPVSFVRRHGDKFTRNCKLGYGHTKPCWEVKVQVYFMKKHPHVSFQGGWKDFARSHNIQIGDTLRFELVKHCGLTGFSVEFVTANGDAVIEIFSDDE